MAMNEKEFIRQRKEDLVINPSTRIAVALCLDNSGSMEGAPIAELNEGIKVFYDAVLGDEVARYSVEMCTVSFDYEAVLVQDFCDIGKQKIPVLTTRRGVTHIGEGVNMALDMLERRKKEYTAAGVNYYQPWLVLMTDGEPVGEDESVTQSAMRRATDLVNNRKLTVFPIGIGDEANRDTLKGFSPKNAPMKLQGLKFKEFFEWLGKSAATVSNSTAGNAVTVETPKMLEPWHILEV